MRGQGAGIVAIEAGARAEVASGARRPGADQQRVTVAIRRGIHQFQYVPGGFPLAPQAVATSAVEGDQPVGEGALQGLATHVTEHEDRAVAGVLHHCRQQAAALLPIQLFRVQGSHGLTSTPQPAK